MSINQIISNLGKTYTNVKNSLIFQYLRKILKLGNVSSLCEEQIDEKINQLLEDLRVI